MFELVGKYNTAKIFTDNCDVETQSQIVTLLNQQFVQNSKIRIMPDTHAGAGCVIGTTMTLLDKVVPNLVGVDIGCGMLATKLNKKEIDLEKLDKTISSLVPCGFNKHRSPIADYEVDKIYAPIDIDNSLCSLGTLGGGNHFIEVDRDSEDNLWLVVHTGSRHLGIEVCKYYQNIAIHSHEKVDKVQVDTIIDELISNYKSAGREKEISSAIKEIKSQFVCIPKDLCYVFGPDFNHYIHDMELSQEYAKKNRQVITQNIMYSMDLYAEECFDTVHNYIDTNHNILRKGAVSAQLGEKLIIPMNMRDGSLICTGKGNPDWNFSAPHGAGRIMSRSAAKENVLMDEFEESMKGIYSTSVCESTIDESPMVYKPMQEIIDNIVDTVEVVDIIKPIYNFKAH